MIDAQMMFWETHEASLFKWCLMMGCEFAFPHSKYFPPIAIAVSVKQGPMLQWF